MWTLQSFLEALAHLGPLFVVQEADGFAWPADELLDWLEWQAPERLAWGVGFSGPDDQGGGRLYAFDDQGAAIGPDPLYWIVPRQAGALPTLPRTPKEDDTLLLGEPRPQREQDT